MAELGYTLLYYTLLWLYFSLLHSTMTLLDSIDSTTLYNVCLALLNSSTLYHGSTWLYLTLYTLPWLYLALRDCTALYQGSILGSTGFFYILKWLWLALRGAT